MEDTVRYGIIGTGMMGHEHIRNLALLPGAEVVAISDPESSSRWWARQLLEGVEIEEYTDHRDLLRKAPVDAVVVASPNHTHRAVLEDIFASAGGKHVLVEKPLCTTVEDARTVAERAERHAGVVWVGMEYRFMPPLARLLDEVRGGTIGKLRMLAIREHRYPFLPKVGDWNRFSRNTGGTFVEKCCHFFDLMRLISDSEPVRVYASAGQDVNHLDEKYDGETPDILDNGFVVVDFESGVRGLLDLCMFAEASRNEQEISATGDAGKVECFIPESKLVVGRRNPRSVEEQEVDVDARTLAAGVHHGSTFVEHQEFRKAILSGSPPAVSAVDGLRAVEMGVAAERSAVEGRAVEMTDLI
ncbi:MAG: Gfo/Idh/MocA family oxidoreductase [Proteobacteria bacterium]|nr:Gfo/Idh/MocA family oxidoreductase [Pseudomonadota bacterium]